MNHNCLNCKHWDRLYENPDVGVCELHNDSIIPACKSQAEIERAFDLNMPDTPDRHLRELADALNRAVEAVEVKYSPDQPREPAGSPEGGQWVRQESPGGRAPAGLPTLAMNGLIYYPGEFLPSTELMPLEKKKREKIYKYMQKKQEIEPYKWELPPGPEYSPLLQRLSPIADWNKYRETGILEAVTNQNILDKFGGSDYQGLINLWNSGERWYINPYRLAELNKSVDLDKQEESVEAVEVKYSDSQPRVPVLDRAKVRRESECGCNSRTNLC